MTVLPWAGGEDARGFPHFKTGLRAAQDASVSEPLDQFRVWQGAVVSFAHQKEAIAGDPPVSQVPERFREESSHGKKPPSAAEGAGEFDQGIAL